VLVSSENGNEHLNLVKERAYFCWLCGFNVSKRYLLSQISWSSIFFIETYIAMFLIIVEFYIILIPFIINVNY